jgi:hypothetical protein
MQYKSELDFDEKCWCVVEWSGSSYAVRTGTTVAKFYGVNAETNCELMATYLQEEYDELEYLNTINYDYS